MRTTFSSPAVILALGLSSSIVLAQQDSRTTNQARERIAGQVMVSVADEQLMRKLNITEPAVVHAPVEEAVKICGISAAQLRQRSLEDPLYHCAAERPTQELVRLIDQDRQRRAARERLAEVRKEARSAAREAVQELEEAPVRQRSNENRESSRSR